MMTSLSRWLLLLIIGLLPIVRPFSFRISGFLIPLTDLIFPLLFVSFSGALLSRRIRLAVGRVHCFIGLYGVALIVSAGFSGSPAISFIKVLGEVYLFGLAVITFGLSEDRRFLKKIVIAWLAGTGITIAGSLLGVSLFYLGFKSGADNYFLSHFGSLPKGNYPRVHSFFANANMMCNYLNVSLLLTLLAGRMGWLKRYTALIFQSGIWIAALFTFSAGIGGLILSYGLWFAATASDTVSVFKRRLVLVSCSLIAIAAVTAALVSPDTDNTDAHLRIPVINVLVEPSVRVLVWRNTIDNVRSNPWLGVGTGLTPTNVFYITVGGQTQHLRDAHNVWLSVLGQSGLLGLLTLIALTSYLTSCCKIRSKVLSEVALTRIAVSLAFIAAFLYQGLIGSFEDSRHLWILFGIVAATSLWRENDTSTVSESP